MSGSGSSHVSLILSLKWHHFVSKALSFIIIIIIIFFFPYMVSFGIGSSKGQNRNPRSSPHSQSLFELSAFLSLSLHFCLSPSSLLTTTVLSLDRSSQLASLSSLPISLVTVVHCTLIYESWLGKIIINLLHVNVVIYSCFFFFSWICEHQST